VIDDHSEGGGYNLVVGVVNEDAKEHLPVDGVVPAGPGLDLHHLLERRTMSGLAPLKLLTVGSDVYLVGEVVHPERVAGIHPHAVVAVVLRWQVEPQQLLLR